MEKNYAVTTPKLNAKSRKVFQALELVDRIQVKVASLKHGYIADNEFAELKKVIVKI